MSELPNGWAQTILGEVIFFNYGKSLAAAKRKGGIVDVFGSNGIVGQHDEAITQAPAIIVGRKGSFGEVHLSEAPCFPIDTTYFVDNFPATDPKFAYSLLRYLPLKEMNRATAIPGLNREDAHSLPIPLPPLPEQRRIVKKLDTLSARTTTAREHLTAIGKLVERYKLAFLENVFFGSDAANHHSVSFLETAVSTQNGLSKRKGDEGKPIKVLRLADLKDNEFRGDDPREIVLSGKELEKFALHDGDILIVRVNGSEKIVGRMLVWGEEQGWAFCDHFIRAKTLENFDPKFVRWLFETDRVRGQIESSFVSSAGQKTINKTILSEVKVPKLPTEEQHEIVQRIEAAFAKIDRLADEAKKALKLTGNLDQRILAKAFSGELVPQDPNDEAASKLLARIQEARANAPKKLRKKPTKAKPMKVAPQERVLTDSAEWPVTGLPFEEVANRITLPHDDLKDAVFALLEGDAPKLRQEFDTDAQIMKLIRVAS